jgi:hypothetical protein
VEDGHVRTIEAVARTRAIAAGGRRLDNVIMVPAIQRCQYVGCAGGFGGVGPIYWCSRPASGGGGASAVHVHHQSTNEISSWPGTIDLVVWRRRRRVRVGWPDNGVVCGMKRWPAAPSSRLSCGRVPAHASRVAGRALEHPRESSSAQARWEASFRLAVWQWAGLNGEGARD